VEGYFLQDSAMLGERTGYILKAEYPESFQILFPDSSFNFGDQVLLEKQVFATSTNEGTTLDSAVYYISNFSLDSSIYVALPVYEILPFDSIAHYPLEDELKLKLTLDSIPEELQFKQNNVYQPLEKEINWIIISIWLVILFIVLAIIYFLFGNRIRKFFAQRNQRNKWKRFEKLWDQNIEELLEQPSIDLADDTIGLWKSYMEDLTHEPYQEWTSSEISEKMEDQKVFDALRGIDLIIYAGIDTESQEATTYLKEIAQKTFREKLMKIKNERTV